MSKSYKLKTNNNINFPKSRTFYSLEERDPDDVKKIGHMPNSPNSLPSIKKIEKNEKAKSNFIKCNSDYILSYDSEENIYTEELIRNLWEELGVTKEYQNQFEKLSRNLSEEEKNYIYTQEKNNLNRFKNILIKLTKEINHREKSIKILQKINESLLDNFYNDKIILKDVINILKNIRIHSINVVFYTSKIREIASYYCFQGKWDLRKLNKEYLYDNTYLLKMDEDLNFLQDSILCRYIDIDITDSFCSPQNYSKNNNSNENNNLNKIIIPMGEDILQSIQQSKYLIFQDKLLDGINNMNAASNNNNYYENDKIVKKMIDNKKTISKQNLSKDSNIIQSRIGIKGNYPMDSKMSKTIYALKNNNPKAYNNLFKNANLNYFKKNEPFSINEWGDKKNDQVTLRIRTQNNFSSNKNYNNEKINNIQQNFRIKLDRDEIDSKNNLKNKFQCNTELNNNLNENNNFISNQKNLVRENYGLKLEIKNIKIENERIKRDFKKSFINNKRTKENTENMEEKNQQQFNKNEEKNRNEVIPENNITTSKKDKEKNNTYKNEIKMKNIQKKEKIKYNNMAQQLKKNLSLDISSKEISENNKFKIEFFKDSLTTLISKIQYDLNLDEVNQLFKYLFDINENNFYDEETYSNGYYPKILISTSYKSDNKINGICSLSYDNENKLYINFIIMKNSENFGDNIEEMETFVNFIKIHFCFDELILKFKQDNFKEHNEKFDYIIYLLEIKNGFSLVKSEDNSYIILSYNKKENITNELNNSINSENLYNDSENNGLVAKTLSIISLGYNYGDSDNFSDNKYFNLLPVYPILSKDNFLDILYKKNQNSVKVISENDNNFELMKNKLLNINKNICKIIEDESLCNKKLAENKDLNSTFTFILSMDFNFIFKSIQNLEYNDYYYNCISCTNMIKIYDEENDIIFYLIPSAINDSIFLFFAELSLNSKSLFIPRDSNKNICQIFSNYINNIENMNKEGEKTNIYVPCFEYEKHFMSENLANVINSAQDIYDLKTDLSEDIFVIGDEFSKMSINKISNTKNNFKVNVTEDDENILIKNEFICGIINIESSENLKIFLLQLAHVKKDYWIKKNYKS